MLSVIVNLSLAAGVAWGLAGHMKKAPLHVVLRYFTMLSNLLCAVAALAVAVCRLFGAVPGAVLALKFMGTCSVTVTMLTVVFFLGPTLGYRKMFTGPDLWLHLICPVLAVVSLLLWDAAPISLPAALALGVLPVTLYGCLYLFKVLLTSPPAWEDFYGFNRGGKWPVSVVAMHAAAAVIAWLLWRCM